MSEELLDLNEVMKIRRAKLLKLREANIEPFAYAYSRTNFDRRDSQRLCGYEG
jgi:hypothetical protein